MSHPRAEQGFTLIELLMAMALMTVVVMATVSAFASFHRNERVNRLQNESQDEARQVVTGLARELRNLASPTDFDPKAVEKATNYDLMFKTVDPVGRGNSQNPRNLRRMRYCLGTTVDGKAQFYRQEQAWTAPNPTPAAPSTASCPSAAWGNQTVVARNVVNAASGVETPIFAYTPGPTDVKAIKAIRTELVVDVNPGSSPVAATLKSGVYLRNQNRAPVSRCTATGAAGGQAVLNGSGSEDPEGRPLEYAWFLQGDDTNVIATGIVAVWTPTTPETYEFQLVVKDHAGLKGEAFCEGTVTVLP